MTICKLATRINHFFTAKHYRGHGIHSPFLYDFIREVVIKNDSENIVKAIQNHYAPHRVEQVSSIDGISKGAYIAILESPFVSKSEREKWLNWRGKNKCLTVHLKNYMVIFFDQRLNNQHFKVRS